MSRRIYVASSWRNTRHPDVVSALRNVGHEVYNFRNPSPGDNGFAWSEIDPDWQSWTPELFRCNLEHPIAVRGFDTDYAAMERADAFVLVLPCGRSAHLEAGWALGRNIPTAILLDEESEPELMYRMASGLFTDLDELLAWPVLNPQSQ